MVANGSKPQASVAPPRTVNVQNFAESRASELYALHSVVASRLNNDFRFQRNKRRRTTGHDNRVAKNRFRKKLKVGLGGQSSIDPSENKDLKKVPRRIRRRIELRKNPTSGYCTSGDGTKRLRTHVWHAKRFTMAKLWGFSLPLGLQGRGRGSRALLRKLKHGVLVHDASYYGTVQLEGPEDLLVSILSTVMVPYPSANCDQTSQDILSGLSYGRALLCHPWAIFSQVIAPVTYMWQPPHTGIESKGHNNGVCDDVNNSASSRQLWILIHPAAFGEGYDALKSACDRVNVSGRVVNCKSLDNELAKLEIIGLKAFELIQKILHPTPCASEDFWKLRTCSVTGVEGEALLESSCSLKNEDHFTPAAIVSLTVNDPRVFFKKRIVNASEANPSGIFNNAESQVESPLGFAGISKTIVPLSQVYARAEESYPSSEFVDLWNTCKNIIPPLEESVICTERHSQRMKLCRLNDKSSATLDSSEKGWSSRVCPIILLKSDTFTGPITRWSIILPLNWVKAFWSTVILNGAQAIGLREKHWIASEVGLPYFPSDFPDSKAYSCFMKIEESATSNKNADVCPPATMPFGFPILLPWDCVNPDLEERSSTVVDAETSTVLDDSMKKLCCERCDIAVVGGNGSSFDGFVARTSYMLSHFLDHINEDKLLLFPNKPGGNKCLHKVMKDDEMIKQRTNRINFKVKHCQKYCFLRVLLRSFKEGVFEEGAVVCSPRVADITLWTHRCEDGGRLQVPQSLLSSLFVQQPSGKWELEVPEDYEVRESFRQPIGFVTTGFVRGSKKPVASAICNAVSLAHLREEQWKNMPLRQRKKDIYVLVRNLRSTAYRLALATVVLEEQENDINYI